MIRTKRSVRGAAATIALTSGISVVAPAVIGAVAHAANSQTMYATTDVNVRSASSNSGTVLTVVARGQSVQVTGEKVRGWVPVAVNGTTGWIYQRFLTEENILPVHFGSDPLPDTMIATVPVNVRDDSANAGKILTVAERGQEVQVTGRPDGGWVPISVNGKSGWIYGRYLTTGKAAPAPSTPKAEVKTASSTSHDSSTSRDAKRPALDNAPIHTTTGLNMRTAPTPKAKIITSLAEGTGVEATGEVHGNWVQVRVGDRPGWVYRTHLTGKVPAAQPIKQAEPAKPAKHAEPAKTAESAKHAKHAKSTKSADKASIHTTAGLNMRTAPTPKAKIITSLAEGTGVEATGEVHGNWVEVRANGHTGWVYRTHLTGKVPAVKVDTPRREKHHSSDTSRTTTARPPVRDTDDGASDKGSGHVDGRCIASFYDEPQSTASGEQFNPNAMTAAHKTLRLGTRIRVTNVRNGRSVVVRINDRGPYVAGRCVDLSRASFAQIADISQGTTPITYTILN
ncbi:septal ring lytic transglycosylase RlpA family protein [Cutibacterium equinum]|uniref:Probable endolytic peptidoglycan transglycosylase RlpA n=1 Tax=Cutibacterium equinum TaxID=3016342 RepID=A0ABY7QY08_9ACTN|nr:septal ring lytic transglycosylase RlpA family protein [Cutibacterium equinum]WCC79927.1 septal ring lytic transglycosylase RlpA family protein [Cutibacterium equinum]